MTQVFIKKEEEEDKKNKTKKGKRMNDWMLQAHQASLFTFGVHTTLTLNQEECQERNSKEPAEVKNKGRK